MQGKERVKIISRIEKNDLTSRSHSRTKEIPLGCQPRSAVANTEQERSKTLPKTTAGCPRFDAWHVA